MPARLLSVTPGHADTTEFHLVISDALNTQHLESMLTLSQVRDVVARRNYGGVYNLCRAILDTTDYESLVGRQFEN